MLSTKECARTNGGGGSKGSQARPGEGRCRQMNKQSLGRGGADRQRAPRRRVMKGAAVQREQGSGGPVPVGDRKGSKGKAGREGKTYGREPQRARQ